MIRLIRFITTVLLTILFSKSISAQNSCTTPDVLTFGTIQTVASVTPYWDSVPGALSYNLQYRIRNISAPYSASISTSTNSLTLTNLTPSTNYEFIVQSVCSAEVSSFSTSGWFTTPAIGTSATISRGPYLTVATKNSVTVQWKTDIACNSEVSFGTTAGNLSGTINKATVSKDHAVTLTNLQENQKYYYSIGVIGTPLESSLENFFYTAPADNDTVPLRFWVTGDFGSGNSGQRAVRDAFKNYTAGQTVNGWLWLGDNAYANGTDQEYQDNVFDIYPSQFKNIPVYPALGNHDYAQSGYQSSASLGTAFPYFDIFNIPTNSGTEKYYSVNYGNVHFIALDSYGSYNSSSSNMYHWLEEDLSNNNQQWTVVYFHHAPYSKGSHNSDDSDEMFDMRNNIVPLLESNGVDLVLGGHSHAYERSYFIKGHFGVASTFNSSNIVQPGGGPYSKATRTGDGTIYTVCGVSGQLESSSSGYPHNAMYYSNISNYGSLILEFTGTSLSAKYLTSNGAVLDNYKITKPATPLISSNKEIANNKNQDFEIYPNPAHQEFNIHFNDLNEKSLNLRVLNVFGQVVLDKNVEVNKSNNIIIISKNEFINNAPGIYLISCSGINYSSTKTMIIE